MEHTKTLRRQLTAAAVCLTTATAILTCGVPAASATTLVDTGPAPYSLPWQQWADASYMPTYQGSVAFISINGLFPCGAIDEASGCTRWTGNAITSQIDVDALSADNNEPQQDELHELGQLFDDAYLTDADKLDFMQIWGLGTDLTSWWDYSTCANYDQCGPPGEWFAEAYRFCALYGEDVADSQDAANEWTVFGFPGVADPAAMTTTCQLIAQVGQANGAPVPAQPVYALPTPVPPVTTTTTTAPAPAAPPVPVAARPQRHRHRVVRRGGRRQVWMVHPQRKGVDRGQA
jgi:hypothetical protein